MKTVIAIYRDPRFSPNSVEKDRAILDAVLKSLASFWEEGLQTLTLDEANLEFEGYKLEAWTEQPPTCILSMGRLPSTLQWLSRQPGLIVNRPEAVARCGRTSLVGLIADCQIPVPPVEGPDGYWLKRGDACAQQVDDVVFCRDKAELTQQTEVFRQRGISDYVVSAHVVGDLVKFYGVRSTGFFRYFYPTDDGESKFGDEQRNGIARHYDFDDRRLQADIARLADAVGLDVYGGDCIVRSDGSYCVIDFNDWPSFSRCRDEAAAAIGQLIVSSYHSS